MRLNNLDVGTIVTINATDYEKSVRMESEVLSVSLEDRLFIEKAVQSLNKEVFCVLDLITEGKAVINFLSVRVKCTLTALIDDKPYSWNDVKILKLKLPDTGSCHIVLCDDDVDTFNRRGEYRQWLGYDALCKFGDSKVSKDVLLRDLSPSGVGLLCSTELPVELGSKLNIQFCEETKSNISGEYVSRLYTINAVIVRYVPTNNNKLLVGCKLDKEYEEINKLIFSKQGRLLATAKRDAYKRDRNALLAQELKKEMEKK